MTFGWSEYVLSRKRLIPQRLVPVERGIAVHPELLDSQVPVQGQAETESVSDLVFAKRPVEQDLPFHVVTGTSLVTILLLENIRIEVGADCPARLMDSLLQALKSYA